MADTLDEIMRNLDRRIAELRPAVEELEKLEKARAQLDGVEDLDGGRGRRRRARSGDGRRRSRRGRPRKGESTRAEQLLQLVDQRPEGIKVAEAARELGMEKPNSLYAVTRKLEQQGRLRRQDGRLVPVQSESS